MKKEENAPAQHIRQRYLKIAQALDDWARMEDFCRMAAGKDRFHQAESAVGWLAKTGQLVSTDYHKRKVYQVHRKARSQFFNREQIIDHGLGCTDVRVRIAISDRQAEIIPERFFRHQRELGINPDGGFAFPNGWVLLNEFCTTDNSQRLNVLRWKVNHYRQILTYKPTYQVLFVLDIPSEKMCETVPKLVPHEAIFYVDYQTFQTAPLGQQLAVPIYIYGGNGQTYPLRKS